MKANPGLGSIKSIDKLRGYVQKAKADDTFRPTVLVKDFNMKQNASNAWLRYEDIESNDTFNDSHELSI